MKSNAVLELLSDRQVHSGESLAAHLGVSRTAVWKQIRRATEEGHAIKTIRGKGYQLMSALDLLDRDTICSLLTQSLRTSIDLSVHDELDSTNAELIRRRESDSDRGALVCIADHQTAGRGRRGRQWSSPRGENLYLSLELVFHGGFSVLDGLSLVLGLVVAEALEREGVPDVGLKWPNDVYLNGKKLAGILVELQGELEEGVVRVVAGIGLNVHMQSSEQIDQSWTSLANELPEQDWNRNQLAATIINAVYGAVDQFVAEGFAAFQPNWQVRDVFEGQSLVAREGTITGIGLGVDVGGNYRLDIGGQVECVRAGEISLRVSQ